MTPRDKLLATLISGERGYWYFDLSACFDNCSGGMFSRKADAMSMLRNRLRPFTTAYISKTVKEYLK